MAFLVWGGIITEIFWARTESVDALFQSLSWTDRLVAWQSAWQMIVHNPLVGVGPGMFGVYYPTYEVKYLEYFQTTGVDAHNLLLHVWAETGPLAMIGLTSTM